jgi:SAM-dependent methyltransferase
MNDRQLGDVTGGLPLDLTKPSVARMYDYFLGGKDNFPVDRETAEQVARALPTVAGVAQANRAFLQRAVRYAAEQGIDQFLDLGAGLPTQGNVHEIAQQVHKEARVVYVDNDPIVLVHGRALLETDDHTRIVQNDVRDPEAVLSDPQVRELIDFDRPVAVLFVAVLHFVTDDEDPAAIVRRFRDALTPGSHLVISHAAVEEKRNLRVGDAYRPTSSRMIARSREEVTALLAGLDPVPPGTVPLHDWRPTGGEYVTHAGWAAVARRP